ncbi:YrrS family protein [Oceanobacillus rekensis]|uniref:YrrS family protein n=1 Tax=Oceanobacillus rekensis TaxID=937927 RepID=UPI000B439AAA|nr:YrrS family protein [Oceanobacillus rekensis]
MSESDKHSRLNKFEKRRKNTKTISIFLIVGAFLLLLLLGIWFFGGGDSETDLTANEEEKSSDFLITEEDDEESGSETENDSSENNSTTDEESKKENESEEDENNSEENEEEQTEPAEPSDDNVEEAYTGNWEPVGTEQEGPHTMNFNDGSQDRIEIKSAASMVTGIPESEMVEWWVGNNGDQKAIATVSHKAETEVYRVFLSWIENEGWQPTKVEILIENDKK